MPYRNGQATSKHIKKKRMRATVKEAYRNERGLQIEMIGYGHWKISCLVRGVSKSCITTNSYAVDLFRSDELRRDGRSCRRQGYIELCSEIIRKNYGK